MPRPLPDISALERDGLKQLLTILHNYLTEIGYPGLPYPTAEGEPCDLILLNNWIILRLQAVGLLDQMPGRFIYDTDLIVKPDVIAERIEQWVKAHPK